ncbi:uncharacterized protein LOC115363415 [Myripristis murdjan]|uniref:uncharacterized protein LOC115363415 n=1 Tax=Myripristis murdjan TaxID=586833 RepID=UPI001176371F|nr:uncharacterized protein LOC115363415 [Myripristis murdjan]
MEDGVRGSSSDVGAMHVKIEAVDENASALVLGSQEASAPCGGTACGGGGGLGATTEELGDPEQQAATNTTPVMLSNMMLPTPSERALTSSSDFSSKAVLCLIEAVGRRWGLYETRERSQLFQSVQEEMVAKGYVLPVEKIRRKWNNLIVTYKRVKDRSRETGHAKTSWEFFDLMDATLSDTVGAQIIGNKKSKVGSTMSTLSGTLSKIAAKPQAPQSNISRYGDFSTTGAVESVGQVAASAQISIIGNNSDTSISSMNSMATTTITPGTNVPELKPLIVLNGDIVTTSIQPTTLSPSPSSITSPYSTDTTSPSLSLGLTTNTDLTAHRYISLKAPPLSSGVVPFRLSNAQLGSKQHNLLSMASSFPPTSSSLTSSTSTSFSSATMTGTEGQNQMGNEEQSSATWLQEMLRRQEEQAYLDRVSRRRAEARGKKRERREVRMAESLSRIATALELLSSKQDTVIALLQRLADRK